jgi:hypothetical protein
VPGAVVSHCREGYLVHPSGVFDAAGAYVHEAVQWRQRPLMTPPPFPETTDPLPGRWLWAGVLMEHFGHFLTESLGRLWALDALDGPLDGIVYLPEKGFGAAEELALKGYQQRFFDLLGIELPVRLLTRPTRVDRLEVPGPGFGIGPMIGGSAAFRAFIKARLAPGIAAQGAEKIYISRSRLDRKLGGILAESLVEKLLVQEGYAIYHPQLDPIEAQIARFRAASHVISLDGSALHLLALVARPGQQVAVIKRRGGGAPDGIVRHLEGFTGQRPLVIDVIVQNWVRSDRQSADNYSYGELDFVRLANTLAAHGYLPPGARFPMLSPRRAQAAIAKIEERTLRTGLHYTARPAPGAPEPLPPAPKSPEERARKRASRAAKAARAEQDAKAEG